MSYTIVVTHEHPYFDGYVEWLQRACRLGEASCEGPFTFEECLDCKTGKNVATLLWDIAAQRYAEMYLDRDFYEQYVMVMRPHSDDALENPVTPWEIPEPPPEWIER